MKIFSNLILMMMFQLIKYVSSNHRKHFINNAGRSPRPRGRYGSGRDPTTSLLVLNLRRNCRSDDLRRTFGQFGPLKDIYLPRDYYTGNPRGFGFVHYYYLRDAEAAKYQLDGQILLGREMTVVFSEENRKKPNEKRSQERVR